MPKIKRYIANFFTNIVERIKNRINREFLIYLLFLLIAIVIWFLNALNKEYTTELNFSTKYVDLPTDKVLVDAPAKYLSLTVNAQGFTLLKHRLGWFFHSININANYQTLKKDRLSTGEYYLLSTSVFRNVSEQLGSDINLLRISPDTLKFFFSEAIRKKVPVKIQALFQYEKEFRATGAILTEPAVITVSGPKSIVDTIQHIYTKERTFKKLKANLQAKIALQPIEKLTYSIDEVSISLPVERHTEASVVVPIETISLPAGYVMKTFPGTVAVSCMVPNSRFDKLQPQMFRAVVDYNVIRKEETAKAKIIIIKSPNYVTDIRFHPKTVDFIVEK
jgi:hypothetical protein